MTRTSLPVLLLVTLMSPGLAFADREFDDLEVTMEVLESEGELNVLINEMRGPRKLADRAYDSDSVFSDDAYERFEELEPGDDNFYDDDLFRNDPLLAEDDFESLEGENLDLDEVMEEEPVYEEDYE